MAAPEHLVNALAFSGLTEKTEDLLPPPLKITSKRSELVNLGGYKQTPQLADLGIFKGGVSYISPLSISI